MLLLWAYCLSLSCLAHTTHTTHTFSNWCSHARPIFCPFYPLRLFSAAHHLSADMTFYYGKLKKNTRKLWTFIIYVMNFSLFPATKLMEFLLWADLKATEKRVSVCARCAYRHAFVRIHFECGSRTTVKIVLYMSDTVCCITARSVCALCRLYLAMGRRTDHDNDPWR